MGAGGSRNLAPFCGMGSLPVRGGPFVRTQPPTGGSPVAPPFRRPTRDADARCSPTTRSAVHPRHRHGAEPQRTGRPKIPPLAEPHLPCAVPALRAEKPPVVVEDPLHAFLFLSHWMSIGCRRYQPGSPSWTSSSPSGTQTESSLALNSKLPVP